MPGFSGFTRLLAVPAGVLCALVMTASLRAQDARPVVEGQVALSASSVVPIQRPGHADTFAALIQEIGFDDLLARKEAAGEKEFRVDWRKVNRLSIGLSDDEWRIAYSILLDGSARIDAWSDQMHDTLGWSGGRFVVQSSTGAAVQMAKMDSLDHQGEPIVAETITRLKHELGEASFEKLEAFAHQHAGRRSADVEEASIAQAGNRCSGPAHGAQR
jgi:hypothetical protein